MQICLSLHLPSPPPPAPITFHLLLPFSPSISHSVFLVLCCLDFSLGISVLAGCLSISGLSRSPFPPSPAGSFSPLPHFFFPSFSVAPFLPLCHSVFVLPSYGYFIYVSLLLPIRPLCCFPCLFLCVSGFCSDGPSAGLYFYPSDTPPVSTSLSVCLSPSCSPSGPSSRSQLVGGCQGRGRAPTPGSSLPLAAPNEPGGGS